jgi:hypothetical protein
LLDLCLFQKLFIVFLDVHYHLCSASKRIFFDLHDVEGT